MINSKMAAVIVIQLVSSNSIHLHQTSRILLLRLTRHVSFYALHQIKKCDRESAHRLTDRHAQRQTECIICPMLLYML